MSKSKVPHYVRWRYAMDATPEIKGVEASPAALSDAKAVIDAQMEGSTPRNIGIDLDKDASIDEIVMKFFPGASPEDTETIVELLKKYKSQPVTVEVEDGEDVPLPVEEAIKDETPDEQRAFAEGVKYGELKSTAALRSSVTLNCWMFISQSLAPGVMASSKPVRTHTTSSGAKPIFSATA